MVKRGGGNVHALAFRGGPPRRRRVARHRDKPRRRPRYFYWGRALGGLGFNQRPTNEKESGDDAFLVVHSFVSDSIWEDEQDPRRKWESGTVERRLDDDGIVEERVGGVGWWERRVRDWRVDVVGRVVSLHRDCEQVFNLYVGVPIRHVLDGHAHARDRSRVTSRGKA